ncbi:hypothetical protein ACFX2C_013144 [Malus domestica]
MVIVVLNLMFLATVALALGGGNRGARPSRATGHFGNPYFPVQSTKYVVVLAIVLLIVPTVLTWLTKRINSLQIDRTTLILCNQFRPRMALWGLAQSIMWKVPRWL